jgi:hypothetical protein
MFSACIISYSKSETHEKYDLAADSFVMGAEKMH